jgi:hypothetical protein
MGVLETVAGMRGCLDPDSVGGSRQGAHSITGLPGCRERLAGENRDRGKNPDGKTEGEQI